MSNIYIKYNQMSVIAQNIIKIYSLKIEISIFKTKWWIINYIKLKNIRAEILSKYQIILSFMYFVSSWMLLPINKNSAKY